MIKYIHCFGTSYTAGGGYEFDADSPFRNQDSEYIINLKKETKQKYPNEEQTQYNFSWPGQLQKLVDSNKIKVLNHAKTGYGNERIYRKAYKIINEPTFNPNEHLFLIEFSDVGRAEFWSNTLQKYLICNYHFKDYDKDSESNLDSIGHNYCYDNGEKIEHLDYVRDIYEKYFYENSSIKDKLFQVQKNIDFFRAYLHQNDINYLITSGLDDRKYNIHYGMKYNGLESDIEIHFVDWFQNRKLSIQNDTNQLCEDDTHMSMDGCKKISKLIYKALQDKKFI